MKRGKPVNLRPGRTTVVTLPSGEEVAFEPEQDKGHLLLRITAPEGSQIDHRKLGDLIDSDVRRELGRCNATSDLKSSSNL